MSGQLGKEKLAEVLNQLREHSVKVNQDEASLLNINPSAAITCVKPSGTVSQLTGVSSGMHPWHNNYYIRTVRGDKKDPLTEFLIQSGVPAEDDVMKPHDTTVFSFPIKSPENAVLRHDLSATEHLDIWLVYQQNWCEHKPSITISVKEDEWMEVGSWVWKNFDEISGISFLPYSDHTYKQAPYQDATKEEYEDLLGKMPKEIRWSDLSFFETEDGTRGSQEFACSSDTGCEVVDIT
jgi:ribonucleoside-diphosphate reductase alpha chain